MFPVISRKIPRESSGNFPERSGDFLEIGRASPGFSLESPGRFTGLAQVKGPAGASPARLPWGLFETTERVPKTCRGRDVEEWETRGVVATGKHALRSLVEGPKAATSKDNAGMSPGMSRRIPRESSREIPL